jgi:membrane-associated HD superfamily phosphohydrolase
LAVFTAFNILANNKFPLIEALGSKSLSMHWRQIFKFSAILFFPNFLLGVFFGYFLLDNLYEPINYYFLLQILTSLITTYVVYIFVKKLPNQHLLNVLFVTCANYLIPLFILVYLIGLEYFSEMVLFEFILYFFSVVIGYKIASHNKKDGRCTTA